MGGLGFLIYPWGIVVQGLALWHFVKRRPENYWLYIIIFGGVLGAGVYVIAEMVPDLGVLRGTFQDTLKLICLTTLERTHRQARLCRNVASPARKRRRKICPVDGRRLPRQRMPALLS